MASSAQLTFLLAFALLGWIASSPVPTASSCSKPCTWTEWLNVYKPTNETTSGDFETLDNLRLMGHDVCQKPRDIECRATNFSYIPFDQLYHETKCDAKQGLTCFNTVNTTCLDYEVKLLCCPCDQEAKPPIDDLPCSNLKCDWSPWFNLHTPTGGPDGGDFESFKMVQAKNHTVCRSALATKCRLASFSHVPFEQLYYKHECGVNNSLSCINKHQENGICLDYEIQFFCCACNSDTTTTTTTSKSYTEAVPNISTDYFQLGITKHDSGLSGIEPENENL